MVTRVGDDDGGSKEELVRNEDDKGLDSSLGHMDNASEDSIPLHGSTPQGVAADKEVMNAYIAEDNLYYGRKFVVVSASSYFGSANSGMAVDSFDQDQSSSEPVHESQP